MPLDEGLYKVQFQTPNASGSGVVYLTDGKLRGGDSIVAYSGTYSQEGDTFAAEASAKAYAKPPAGMAPVFGVDEANISLKGQVDAGTGIAKLEGSAKEAPGVVFQAILSRLGD